MKNPLSRSVMKSCLFGAFLFLNVLIPRCVNAAGVTVITHGYDGDVTGWITGMADEIPAFFHNYRYPGLSTNFTIYTVTLTTDGNGNYFYQSSLNSGDSPTNADAGEIIVKLDWSQMAGDPNPLSSVYDIPTYTVAWAASYVLLQTNTIPSLNGHALAEYPIHLIGHSRGGSLISQISYILGTNGVWVDHLTTLDPHPLNNDIFVGVDLPVVIDAPANKTYENVLFADNYWENLGSIFDFLDVDPNGEPVAGAYVRQLTDLSGGYTTVSSYHSNAHLWYHGTINLATPANDTEASITSYERTKWYVPYEDYDSYDGAIAGFYYSLIGGGDRMSKDHPLGLPSDPAVVDGYNQYWDLGAGISNPNRTVLPSNNGTWPNIIKFDINGTNVVTAGNLFGVKLYYQYAGSSNLTLQIYYDNDLNPYNSNSILIGQLQPSVIDPSSVYYYSNLGLTTTNVPPGTYAIYGKISDGVHTRYLYTPELVEIVSSAQPPVLDITKLNGAQFAIGVSGVSGQTIVVQTSFDLRNWLPLTTNKLTSTHWIYTNNLPNLDQQYFRAVLAP